MPFVFSPSNLTSWKSCPRRFQAQSLTKELPWKASEQKSRGMLIHSVVQKALREGVPAVAGWPEGLNMSYTQSKIQFARELMSQGWELQIEYEMAIEKDFRPTQTGWWDDRAWLRARADAILIPPPGMAAPVFIADIKTGRIYDRDAYQLRIEAFLARHMFDSRQVAYAYWYVDQGESVSGTIDFTGTGTDQLPDIFADLHQMQRAIDNNFFPATRNKFCRWCGLYQTPRCGA